MRLPQASVPQKRIPIAGPWITDLETGYVTDAAANGWYGSAGDYVRRFEESFARHTGRAMALALPSCTSAIHLVLAGLDIGPGDEVVVPDVTWIASAAPISYVGANAVFADMDPSTWCVSPEAVKQVITDRTRAIIAVDLYGSMPDMEGLASVAEEFGIFLIEDAAEAIGSRWNGHPAGAFGKASVFSFHGSKTLTTGEGGMAVTDDPELYARMQQLADHGRPPGDTEFFNREVAFKYKMSALQAACGLAQLERLPELVAKKRQIFAWYRDSLENCEGILNLNAEPDGTFNSYWMVTCILDPSASLPVAELRAELAAYGIDTRPFFRPLSSLPPFEGTSEAERAQARNTVSYSVAPQGLNLPSALSLEKGDVQHVASILRRALKQNKADTPLEAAGPAPSTPQEK